MPLQCKRKRAFVTPFSQSKSCAVKGQDPSWACPSATKKEAEKNQPACSPVHIGRHVQIITPKTRYKIKQRFALGAGIQSCKDTSPGLVVPFELSQASCLSESADYQVMDMDTSSLDKTRGEVSELVENTEEYEELDLELDHEKLIRETNVQPANIREDEVAITKMQRKFDMYNDKRTGKESKSDETIEVVKLFVDDQGTGIFSAETKLPLSEVINLREEQDYINPSINPTTENYLGNEKDTSSNFIKGPADFVKDISYQSFSNTSPKDCSPESEYAKSGNICIGKGPMLEMRKPEITEHKTDNIKSSDSLGTPGKTSDLIKGYIKVVHRNHDNGHKKIRAATNIQKKPTSKFMSTLANGKQKGETLMKTGTLPKNVKEMDEVLGYSPLTTQPLKVTTRKKRQKKLTFEQLKKEVLKTTFKMHKEIIELQERRIRLKAGLFDSKGDKCKTKIYINRRKLEE